MIVPLIKPGLRKGFSITIGSDQSVVSTIENVTGCDSLLITTMLETEINFLSKHCPQCVFIDMDHDAPSKLSLLKVIRENFPESLIIAMATTHAIDLLEDSLLLGAHDFIWKPMNPIELRARLFARSAHNQIKSVVKSSDIKLYIHECRLQGPNGSVNLRTKEAKALSLLMNSKHRLMAKSHFQKVLWGKTHVSINSIDQVVMRLRKILKTVGSKLQVKSKYGGLMYLE